MARKPDAPPAQYFIRFVDEPDVEATANEAHAAGYRDLDWSQVAEGDGFKPARWMVYGALPDPDVCPVCGLPAEGEESEE